MFDSVPWWMWIVGFLAVLGPLVTVHELGHYLVGRWFGVKADVFSIGFGKELAGYTDKRGTRWKLSALPLGGYVQFAGDMSPASQPSEEWLALPLEEREQCFQAKPLWQKALIVAAGPVTNLLVAIVIYAAFALSFGLPTTPPVVEVIAQNSPADRAGLQLGDRITRIDGSDVTDFIDVVKLVSPFPGKTVELTYDRGGQAASVKVTLADIEQVDRFGNKGRIGQLGIASRSQSYVPVGPLGAALFAADQTVGAVDLMITGLGQIITGQRSVDELGGPIKIAKFSGEQLSLGWLTFVQFVALISINLAFINLLPIPALDGGHLAFYAAEAIRRKPASPRSQEWAYRTGIAFVLALMLFVTVNDIASLPIFGG